MKKIISAMLAAAMLLSVTTAFAVGVSRAVVMCYDNGGTLTYSSLLRNGDIALPSAFDDSVKKVYIVDTNEFTDWDGYKAMAAPEEPTATEAPAPTAAPASTVAPKATNKPSSSNTGSTPYEKEVDGVYAPAVVVESESSVNDNGDDVYVLTVFYHGEEIKVTVEEDILISTAPNAYSYMKGKDMSYLEKGDVIAMAANIRGDRILTVDFITRPTDEDIVTGGEDYGDNFERLFASGLKVADKWSYIKYGQKPSSDKYQYAYGIVAKMSNGALTLLNTSGITDDAIEIDVDANAYVYTCAVNGKEYDLEIGSRGDIFSTLPSKILNDDVAALDSDYAYNYALVRIVDDTATDVVVFTNYND